jgi:hypothetical protein
VNSLQQTMATVAMMDVNSLQQTMATVAMMDVAMVARECNSSEQVSASARDGERRDVS